MAEGSVPEVSSAEKAGSFVRGPDGRFVARGDGAARTDGILNVISGLGDGRFDKRMGARFRTERVLTSAELEEIYRGDGVGRRLVDLPVQEMTREWFELEGADEAGSGVLGDLEALYAKSYVQDALAWAALYGGSLLVLGLEDGGKFEAPVNEGALERIAFFQVYDRHQVTWTSSDLYSDPEKPKFNTPEFFRVTPYSIAAAARGGAGGMFRVHETRCLVFQGAKVPPRAEREQQGWGDSVIQAPYEQLRNFLGASAYSAALVEEFAVAVFQVKNLVSLLSSADGEKKLLRRLEVLNLGKSILRAMVLAEGEAFEKKSTSVQGLAEILDRLAQVFSAACGIPISLLLGEPPSGLQASGEAPRQNWADQVRAWQEARAQRQVERLCKLAFLARQGAAKGLEPKGWKVKWRPLFQLSPTQEAALRKTIAETDAIYEAMGAATPEEIATSRWAAGRYSAEMGAFDPELHEPGMIEPEPAPAPIDPETGLPEGDPAPDPALAPPPRGRKPPPRAEGE